MTEDKPGLGERCRHYQHALKLLQHGDHEGARDALLLSVDVDACNARAWAMLSDVYEDMDEPEHAAEAANQAIRSEPHRPEWRVLHGVKLHAIGKAAAARAAFDEALTLDASCAGAWFQRATLNAAEGRTGEALSDLATALKLNAGFHQLLEDVAEFDALRDRPDFPRAPDAN